MVLKMGSTLQCYGLTEFLWIHFPPHPSDLVPLSSTSKEVLGNVTFLQITSPHEETFRDSNVKDVSRRELKIFGHL